MNDTKLLGLPLAWLEIITALAMHGYIVYLCSTLKDQIYKGLKEFYYKYYFLIGVCFGLSLIFHPGNKGPYFFTLQMLVSFTIFLEALGLIPQLQHLRIHKESEGLTHTYLYFLAGARVTRFVFWYFMMQIGDSFYFLQMADLLNFLGVVGFLYLYKKSLKEGAPILGFSAKAPEFGKTD